MGKLLRGRNDEYGGVIVHMDDEAMDSATFISSLTSSVAVWKLQGKKGVWLRLPIQRANLVEAAVQQGFWYHYAEPHYHVQGEDIYAAAVREVKEETGIDSEFIEILAFRQIHKSFFQKSDLFFLCMLRPLSFDIQKQEQEIEAAKWMPFEEYAAQPYAQKYEFLMYLHDICKAKLDGNYTGFSPIPTTSYSVQKSYLYLNSTEAPKRYSKL